MSEKLDIYDLESNLIKIQDRKEFYKEIKNEFKEDKKISKKVKSIRLLLMNSSGRLYLQKRSKIKSENAWLYDKSVWGHVVSWDSFDLTLIKECAEELWFPATLMNDSDFKKAVSSTDLSIIWIFRKIEYIDNFKSIRINNDWSQIIQPHMTNIYVWYYDWAIKFVDWECSGIEVFSLEDLKNEIKSTPNKFTEDLKYMIDKYSDILVPINI